MTKDIQPHQKRVLDEQAELKIRLDKLDAFTEGEVFGSLPDRDQELLLDQARAMAGYLRILECRIRRFWAT